VTDVYIFHNINSNGKILSAILLFTDVIDRVAGMKPKSPVEQYRELLPDKWKKQD
jgi:hypothetical protein